MSDIAIDWYTPSRIDTESVANNGISLFTRAAGNGPDVVAVHGGPSASHLSLLPAFDGLAQGRMVRYYDQRGCGRSPVSPDVSLDWHCHLDDLRHLLDFWGIEKAVLIGHSWGALLSLLLASRYPERIDRLVLVAPASITSGDRNDFLERLESRAREMGLIEAQRELIDSGLRRSDPEEFRRRAFELTLAPYLKEARIPNGLLPYGIAHRVREAVWRSLGEYDFTEEISKVSVPVLMIHGEFDIIPLSSSQQIANSVGARLEVFEDSGHMPFFEEYERFLNTVGAFLPAEELVND